MTFGGTISQSTTSAGTSSPGFDVRALGGAVDDLEVLLEFHPIADVGSKDIQPEHWRRATAFLAHRLQDETPALDGVVILHGTDTLHYTSAALSFMLGKVDVPVILTGSMRPGGDRASDSRSNFRAATLAASEAGLRGVFIVFSETEDCSSAVILQGTNARKVHSTAMNAFGPYETTAIGRVHRDRVEVERRPSQASSLARRSTELVENVPIVKASPGLSPQALKYLLIDSAGVVIEGTGVGHVPSTYLPVLRAFSKPVVVTSQAAAGGERLGSYAGDRALTSLPNVIAGGPMGSETAQVKLMWALANHPDSVAEVMKADVCGELAEELVR